MRRGLPLVRGRARVLLVVVPLVAACSRPPEPGDVETTARSWGATAQLVVDRWQHGAVSRKFAALTLDRASSEMTSVAQQAAQLPDTVKERDRVMLIVRTVRRVVTAADSAAQRDDRAGATEAVRWLAPRDHAADAQTRARGTHSPAPPNDGHRP